MLDVIGNREWLVDDGFQIVGHIATQFLHQIRSETQYRGFSRIKPATLIVVFHHFYHTVLF